MNQGPWHCERCLDKFRREGIRDATLDEDLIRYLVDLELPTNAADKQRVLKASGFFSWA